MKVVITFKQFDNLYRYRCRIIERENGVVSRTDKLMSDPNEVLSFIKSNLPNDLNYYSKLKEYLNSNKL